MANETFHSRVINAQPGSGNRPHRLYVIEETNFTGGGAEHDKLRVTAGIRLKPSIFERLIGASIKERNISLVQRAPGLDGYAAWYIYKWRRFKEAGLPVVPTVREADDGSLLMTDLKADGSELYGKGLRELIRAAEEGRDRRGEMNQRNTNIDTFFKMLDLTEIEEQVQFFVSLATQNGIRLPVDEDAFELRIRPDGSYGLLTLDLQMSSVDIELSEKDNAISGRKFLDILRELQKKTLANTHKDR